MRLGTRANVLRIHADPADETVVGTKLVLAQMFLVLTTKTEIASAA
jgi:hypothetical protein